MGIIYIGSENFLEPWLYGKDWGMHATFTQLDEFAAIILIMMRKEAELYVMSNDVNAITEWTMKKSLMVN